MTSLLIFAVQSKLGECICTAIIPFLIGTICLFRTKNVREITPTYVASKNYIDSNYYGYQIKFIGLMAYLIALILLVIGAIN